jgi:hypothetical protein
LGRREPARRRSTAAGEHDCGGSGSRRGGHGLGQHVTLGVVVGSREARGAVGQWGGRAASSGSGGGGNGGGAARVARGEEKDGA